MKTGVFGGSFDPVHIGHCQLARGIYESLSLDRLLIIPAFVSPFKSIGTATVQHRLNMCRLAFCDIKNTVVSDIEIKNKGKSYTFRTLQELHTLYPGDEIYLFTGADSFMTIENWKNPEIIFSLATVCTVPREGIDAAALREHARLLMKLGCKTEVLDIQVSTVSSSDIRRRISDTKEYRHLLVPSVYEYIEKNKLYREDTHGKH